MKILPKSIFWTHIQSCRLHFESLSPRECRFPIVQLKRGRRMFKYYVITLGGGFQSKVLQFGVG